MVTYFWPYEQGTQDADGDYLEQNAPTLYNIIANLTSPQSSKFCWYECTPQVSVGSHQGVCGEEEKLLPDMVWVHDNVNIMNRARQVRKDDALELEDVTHLIFGQTNEEPELEDVTHLFFGQTNEDSLGQDEDVTDSTFSQTNEEPELELVEDVTQLFFGQTNEDRKERSFAGHPAYKYDRIGAVGGLPRLDMDTALYNNIFKEVCDREEVGFMDYSVAFPTSQLRALGGEFPFNVRNADKGKPKQQGRVKPSPQTHQCSVCHELGHWRADCPYNQGNDLGSA
ncbi:hypothetical protein Bbelb_291510 [Branchiostoma belcheri]|nr:hypothetical protein Bbelb_291510 [Branchiostoma belcheri]